MVRKGYNFLRMVPCLLVMAGIFCLSHTPGNMLQLPPVAYGDKLCHAVAYGVLALAFLWAFSPRYRKSSPALAAGLSVIFSFLYGCVDEFHQSFVPLRSPDMADIVADTFGAFCCCVLWWWFCGRPVLQGKGRQG